MRCAFLFVFCYSAGRLLAAFTNEGWEQDLDAVLSARSYGRLSPRMPAGSGFPRPPKSPKPSALTVPEDTSPESDKRYSSPRPSRGRRIDSSHGSSPYSNERSPSLERIARDGISRLRRDASPKRERPTSDGTVAKKLDMDVGDTSGVDETPRIAKDARGVDRSKAASHHWLEAYSLVSGTGYAFSSSKHKYGGLSSQSTAENTLRPVMQSAKDHNWVKAGGMTRRPDGKVTAVATGSKVTGKLGRGPQDKGTGTIEFRAGSAFQQTHKVGPGEKIERTLNAGDVLDSKDNKLKQVTVTTHLTGEGSCVAGACSIGQSNTADQVDSGKDKQV